MMSNNPNILRALSSLEASMYNAQKVQSESLPRLDLEVRGSQYNLSEQSDEYDVYYGLNLSYALNLKSSVFKAPQYFPHSILCVLPRLAAGAAGAAGPAGPAVSRMCVLNLCFVLASCCCCCCWHYVLAVVKCSPRTGQ